MAARRMAGLEFISQSQINMTTTLVVIVMNYAGEEIDTYLNLVFFL